MDRNQFIKGGAVTGAALLFNRNDIFAQGIDNGYGVEVEMSFLPTLVFTKNLTWLFSLAG